MQIPVAAVIFSLILIAAIAGAILYTKRETKEMLSDIAEDRDAK